MYVCLCLILMSLTALEMLTGEGVKAVSLQSSRLCTVQRDDYPLPLHRQVPAIPERVNGAVAVNRVAIQTQLLKSGQTVKGKRGQLGQLVVVQETKGRSRQREDYP